METEFFHVGTAAVDVTPPFTVPYLDVVPRHSFFRGVHDPLEARAVVIEAGEHRVALVAVDALGIARRVAGPDRDFTDEVRKRIHDRCGMLPDHVLLAATHAHSTPDTAGFRPLDQYPGVPQWLDVFRDKIASAVCAAAERREPARLKIGSGMAEGLSVSRRMHTTDGCLCAYRNRPPDDQVADWGIVDSGVPVFLFERPDGTPAAILMRFTCHPTTVQTQPLVSADYPGATRRLVETVFGDRAPAVFLQGPCGSTVPVRGTTDFDDVARYGRLLGAAVVKEVARLSAPGFPCEPPIVGCLTRRIDLPSRPLPDPGSVEAVFQVAKSALERAEGPELRQREIAFKKAAEDWERARLGNGPFSGEVQVVRLGNSALIGLPGEPFPEFDQAVRRQGLPPERKFCIGYANDYLGYIAPLQAWEEGGYEVSFGMWSIVGPDAFELIVRQAETLIEELWRGE